LELIPPRVLEVAIDPDRKSNTVFLLIGEILKHLKSAPLPKQKGR